jgi:hypothetical protein
VRRCTLLCVCVMLFSLILASLCRAVPALQGEATAFRDVTTFRVGADEDAVAETHKLRPGREHTTLFRVTYDAFESTSYNYYDFEWWFTNAEQAPAWVIVALPPDSTEKAYFATSIAAPGTLAGFPDLPFTLKLQGSLLYGPKFDETIKLTLMQELDIEFRLEADGSEPWLDGEVSSTTSFNFTQSNTTNSTDTDGVLEAQAHWFVLLGLMLTQVLALQLY